MFLQTLISAFLALQLVFPLAGEDSVSMRAGVDTTRTRTPVMAISTNIPYDITWIPEYGITSIPSFTAEFYPRKSKHFTFGADVEWPMWKHWDTHRFMQINNITLWTRRYFPKRESQEQRFKGLYLLANANVARYGIGLNSNKGWQGEALGASLGIGHKWVLGKSRMFIDVGLALGVEYAPYDAFFYGGDATGWYYYDYIGDPEEFQLRNKRFFWVGPTRVYISIGVDLFNRKKKR